MRFSRLATKTLKTAPSDEVSKNAILLTKAGYIHKEMAGVYDYLPLGIKVLENIKQIIREEMEDIGGQELIMSGMQRKEVWQKTDRWSDENVDVWFKSSLKNGTEVGLGWSHEEPITDMMRQFIGSYRDLPKFVYQFQTKLRNELRAKSGIMRGREFVMKDMYSYCSSEQEHDAFYAQTQEAYMRVFDRVGLKTDTFLTFASGGAFTQFSHEFQTICEAGEDIVYLSRENNIAINQEVYTDEVISQLGLNKNELIEVKTAEVGNIFSFGTVKTEQLGLTFSDESGKNQFVILGSYGIGVTRLMGVIVEKFADDKGLVWPEVIAPFSYYLINLSKDSEKADSVYEKLKESGKKVLYDDRDERAGVKFADADLLGIPFRLVVGDKTGDKIELKSRISDESSLVDIDSLLQ